MTSYRRPRPYLHHHRHSRPLPPPPPAVEDILPYYYYDVHSSLWPVVTAVNVVRSEYMFYFPHGPPPRFRNSTSHNSSYNQTFFSSYRRRSRRFYQQDDLMRLSENFDGFLDHRNFSNRGLSEEIIDKHMKKRTIDDKDDAVCVICQDGFQEDVKIGVLDNCAHLYHARCMKNWLVKRNTCPICKAIGLNVVD